MVDVRRVKLPGVGVLHTFVAGDGGKVGVISHRSGISDLITFADDGDDHIAGLPLGNMPELGLTEVTVVAGTPEKVAKAFRFSRSGELEQPTAGAAG